MGAVAGAPGPSGLLGQGLENQAGTRAGQENRERSSDWHEGSSPGLCTLKEHRQEAPTF